MGTCMVGWADSRFGQFDGPALVALIGRLSREAITHAGIEPAAVGGIWLGQLNRGFVPEIFASSWVLQADDALRRAPATRVEPACASGAAAQHAACDAVESGRVQWALVVGAEKVTGVFNMDGSAAASHLSILERAR